MPRRRHINWPLQLLLAAVALAALIYMVVIPWLQWQHGLNDDLAPASLGFRVQQHAMQLLAFSWFVMVGASVGSFLNVVVYRLPRGRSISGRSHCPWCAVKIQGRDNVPVISWLALRGRCRSCHLPISPRYPLVELLVSGMFVLLLVVELLSGGANLPLRDVRMYTGFVGTIFAPDWSLIGLYVFHLWLLTNLTAWWLIHWDGHAVPGRYAACCLIVALVAPWVWPQLHAVPAATGPLAWLATQFPWLNRALTGPLGLAAGVLLGNEFDMAWSGRRPQAALFLGLVGAQLGWQAAFSVVLLATMLLGVGVVAHRGRRAAWLPVGVAIWGAALLQVCCWRPLSKWTWWPGPLTSLPWIAASGLLVMVLLLTLNPKSEARNPKQIENPKSE